jgi:tetratricopeptide (TPR) repeat protein
MTSAVPDRIPLLGGCHRRFRFFDPGLRRRWRQQWRYDHAGLQEGPGLRQEGQKCVKQSSANITDDNRTEYAYSLAKAGRYDEALAMLDTLKDQNTAEALNYRGYATRKLGRTDEGISYYLKSVELDPKYAKVREYLGEAYVVKGRIDLARDQLNTIKTLCGTGCEEYQDLNEAIIDPSKI